MACLPVVSSGSDGRAMISDRWSRHRAALMPLCMQLRSANPQAIAASDEPPDRAFLMHHGLLVLWARAGASLSAPSAVALSPQEQMAMRLHARAQAAAIERVAAAWGDAAIPWLALKSIGYRDELYDAAEMRLSTDIDVLIAPEDRKRAVDALFRLGATALDAGSAHEQTFRLDAVDLDVHWDVLAPGRLPRRFAQDVLARRVRRDILWRPDDTDALMIALIHPAFAKHVCSPHMGLNRVCDLLLMLERFAIDEDRLVRQLRAARVTAAAWAVLTWVARITPCAPDRLPRLLERLRPGRVRAAYIARWIERDWPGRLIDRVPWVTQVGLLPVLHDSPTAVVRAALGRLRRRIAARRATA